MSSAPPSTGAPPEGVSRTAQLVAAFRAAEQTRPAAERLFSDPYAELFVTEPRLRSLIERPWLVRLVGWWRERRTPGIIGEALLRYRYADDVLRAAADEGVHQLVVIGAGYDSTALREPAGPGISIYELDQEATQAHKRTVLAERAPEALERATLVPCDLRVETVSEALRRTDFDAGRPAVFNWLGVSMYLTRDEVAATLRDLAGSAAPGSLLVFDYMERAVVDGTTASAAGRRAAEDVRRRGEPFAFGLEHGEASRWLPELGWSVREEQTAAELARRSFPGGARIAAADYMGLVLAERG